MKKWEGGRGNYRRGEKTARKTRKAKGIRGRRRIRLKKRGMGRGEEKGSRKKNNKKLTSTGEK